MILYVTLGSNDIERSMRFYDPVMAALGFARHYADHKEIGYGPVPPPVTRRKCFVWITRPYMKLPATWGNGTQLALPALSRDAVHAFYEAAIENGGIDDGQPGLRPFHETFYACYVRDPDGNKLSAICEV